MGKVLVTHHRRWARGWRRLLRHHGHWNRARQGRAEAKAEAKEEREEEHMHDAPRVLVQQTVSLRRSPHIVLLEGAVVAVLLVGAGIQVNVDQYAVAIPFVLLAFVLAIRIPRSPYQLHFEAGEVRLVVRGYIWRCKSVAASEVEQVAPESSFGFVSRPLAKFAVSEVPVIHLRSGQRRTLWQMGAPILWGYARWCQRVDALDRAFELRTPQEGL